MPLYIFFRAGSFSPIICLDDEDARLQARINPGTTRVETMHKRVIWKETMNTKNQPGLFNCLKNLKPDEPYFVLRAQDSLAADLVELWALQAKGLDCNNDKVLEAQHLAEDMRRWHTRKNPD